MKSCLKYIVVFVMLVVSGATLMTISHRVQIEERSIAHIKNEIAREKETIRILDAEWAFLNNPARLEQYATQYLNLVPPTPDRMVSHFSALPDEQGNSLSPILSSAINHPNNQKLAFRVPVKPVYVLYSSTNPSVVLSPVLKENP